MTTRRKTRTRFIVASEPGRTSFPIDMLRYDACWPAHEEGSSAIWNPREYRGDDGRTRVELLSDSPTPPTQARWASFGWRVISAVSE